MEHEPAVARVVDPARARGAGIILVNPYGHLLLQLRSRDALVDPGVWGVPGGKVEPWETPEQGARRELLEETGVVAGAVELVRTGTHRDTDYWLYCATTRVTEVECNEGEAIVFVPPSQVPRLDYGDWCTAFLVPEFLDSSEYRYLRERYGKA